MHGLESKRKNKVLLWYDPDSAESYSPLNDTGPNYSPTEIEYRFNSHGFRCDEFPDESSTERAPILFMGCSFTEGVGLPLHHCWPHFILEKMKAMPKYAGKHIPFYSLAVAGTGVDAAARVLMDHIDRIKPNIICYLLPSIYRREYCMNNYSTSWLPNNSSAGDLVEKLYSDRHYAIWNTYKSLLQLNLAAQLHRVKIIVWLMTSEELSLISLFQPSLPNLQFHLMCLNMDSTLQHRTSTFPGAPTYARDNAHKGAQWQYTLASQIWETIGPALKLLIR